MGKVFVYYEMDSVHCPNCGADLIGTIEDPEDWYESITSKCGKCGAVWHYEE